MPFGRKSILAALATSVAGLIGGCVIGSGTIYHVDDPFQFFAHAAKNGGIAIMVVGDPYPGQRAQVGETIRAAFDKTFASLGNPFRVIDPTPDPISKIVVLFNTANNIAARTVCADPGKVASAPTGTRTSVRALYCGDGPYSEYSMSFFTPDGAGEGRFAELMHQLAFNTVPREKNPAQR